jgi:hypothetical protein
VPNLGEVLRAAGAALCEQLGRRLLPSQRRALADIAACRTPVLGGHLYQCDYCDELRYSYHSCRNRHCPTCGHDLAARWVDRWLSRLLPCRYYLITVTLPSELRTVAFSHQRTVYSMLLREAAAAVLDLSADRRWVGGRPAILAILHTWTRAALYHPHVHLLVSAGGLSADGEAWVKPKNPRFLLPGYALQKAVRGRFERALRKAGLHPRTPARVWHIPWVAHVKTVGAGAHALAYLGRYLFRVALSNRAIERSDGNTVIFRWTDNATARTRRCTLTTTQLVARFIQHVLPRGFVKVRCYGLFSPACSDQLDAARRILAARRDLLGSTPAPAARLEPAPAFPTPPQRCPRCGVGHMAAIAVLPRQRPPP